MITAGYDRAPGNTVKRWCRLQRELDRHLFIFIRNQEFEICGLNFHGQSRDKWRAVECRSRTRNQFAFWLWWTQIAKRDHGRREKPSLEKTTPPNFWQPIQFVNRGEDHTYNKFKSVAVGCVFRGDQLGGGVNGDYFICDPRGQIVRRFGSHAWL